MKKAMALMLLLGLMSLLAAYGLTAHTSSNTHVQQGHDAQL
jgi:CHASE3 domain sensor protein